jgi:hypothetical protein
MPSFTVDPTDERVRQLQERLDGVNRFNVDLERERDGALAQLRDAEARLERLNRFVRDSESGQRPGVPGSSVESVFYAGRSGDFVGPDGVASIHYEEGDPIPHAASILHLQSWIDSGHIIVKQRAVVEHDDMGRNPSRQPRRAKGDPTMAPAPGAPHTPEDNPASPEP